MRTGRHISTAPREYFYAIGCEEAGRWSYSSPLRVPTPAGDFALLGTGANPARGDKQHVTFTLARAGRARLEVFDVAGRRVRGLADRAFDAGQNTFAWDGCDAGGKPLAAGVYWFRLQSGGAVVSLKAVVMQ